MTLREQLADLQKAMRATVQKAKDEGREISEEELADLEQKSAQATELKERIERADRSEAIFKGITEAPADQEISNPLEAKSLGDFAVKSGVFDRWRQGGGRREASSGGTEFKAPFLTGSLGQTDYGRVVPTQLRRLTIADLVSSGTMSGSSLTYWTQGAVTGAPAAVAEGGAKPVIDFAFSQVNEVMSKLAAITKVSDEAMDDVPYLVSVINSQLTTRLQIVEEDQILNGSGTAPNLRGLLNRSGIQTYSSASAAGNLDAIYHAITLVATGASFLTPDAIVINPADFEKFRIAKDSNNQYYAGGPFLGAYGNGGVPGLVNTPNLWGLQTVVTPAIAAGTVLVGAFNQAAQLFRKGGISIATTNSDVDDFQHDLVALRAEERVLLAVYYASAFVKVTLSAV